jgi:hypothetical protein
VQLISLAIEHFWSPLTLNFGSLAKDPYLLIVTWNEQHESLI